MSDRRLKFHSLLCNDILECPIKGQNCRAYYQSPSTGMQYPAIVYDFDDTVVEYANNAVYNSTRRYQVILIDKDPDSPIIEKLINLPKSKYSRNYKSDNLNHFVFEIYY